MGLAVKLTAVKGCFIKFKMAENFAIFKISLLISERNLERPHGVLLFAATKV